MALQWNGDAVIAKEKAAARHGLTMASEALLAHARSRAPMRDGPLRDSGKATTDGSTAAVSFNTVYAARQHEEVGWAHPNGGEAKYLENAKNDFAGEFTQIIATAVGGAL